MIVNVRNTIQNQLIPSTSPTWFGQVETICDVSTLSPHDTAGYFSVADTNSIKPIDKRAQKAHDKYTKAAQGPGEVYYPGTPESSKGPIETSIMRHGPSA